MAKISSPFTVFFILLSAITINHFPMVTATQWCIGTLTATDTQLQANINFGCNQGGVDYKPIQPGGACYNPNTLANHASFVMNAYYQSHGRSQEACSFGNFGTFDVTDPRYGVKQLQANINFGCNQGGVDCKPIQPGRACYNQNNLANHASFVMNAYYHSHGRNQEACSFGNIGTFAVTNPSYGDCVYAS